MYKHVPDVAFLQTLLNELCAKSLALQTSEAKMDTLDQLLYSNTQRLQELKQAVSSKESIKCCLNDGQPLTDQTKIFRCPNRQKRQGTFGFYDYVFCSLSCVKTYLESRNNFSPQLLVWLTIHAKRDLGVLEDIPSAPAPELLAACRTDGGVSISAYRESENAHKLTEKIKHAPLNKQMWEDEEQENASKPFFELIRDARRVQNQLYQEYVHTNKPIPKAALPDAHTIDAIERDKEQQDEQQQ